MKVWFMKLVDGTLGLVLAQLLAWYAACRGLGAPMVPDQPGHILVVKFFGLGSIQLATPLLRSLRQRFPEARLSFLTFAQNAEFVSLLEDVDEVRSVRTCAPLAFVADTLRVLQWMRGTHFDVVFDLEFFSKYSTILCFSSGAVVRIGFGLAASWRTALLTHSVPLRMDQHIVDSFLEMGAVAGARGTPVLQPPAISEVARHEVDSLLDRRGVDSRLPLVVVNVNAGEKSLLRRWPPQRFVALLDGLYSQGVAVALVGSAGERSYVEGIVRCLSQPRVEGVCNLAGELTLEQVAALMDRATVVVSNDSGPLHLAVALRRPTVSLFGPETPARYGPRGSQHVVLYRSLPCSPCVAPDAASSFRCPHSQQCLAGIGSDEVLALVLGTVRADSQATPTPSPSGWPSRCAG